MNNKIKSIIDLLEKELPDMKFLDAMTLFEEIRKLMKKIYTQRIKGYQDWIDNI